MMIKNSILSALVAVGLGTGAYAAGDESHIYDFDFSFEGPFGSFDQAQLRRGLKVYQDICSGCHGMELVAFRTLSDEGGPALSEEDMKEVAAYFDVYDAELDDTRSAGPADYFPGSNIPAAPDLSLMAKARAGFHGPNGLGINQIVKGMGGAEYIASILTGFTGEEKEEAGTTFYENTAFPGGWIAMAQPLWGEDVDFEDGSPNDIESIAVDVAAYLMWAAEPKMMARKESGFIAFFFMVFLAGLLYFTNKALWAPIKRKD